MRLIVRSLVAVGLAAAALSCSDSPVQPQDVAARLEGQWVYTAPPNNNPGGGYASYSFDLAVQGTTVSGSAIRSWLGQTTFVVHGTVTGGTVELDGNGLSGGVTPVALHFRGTVVGRDMLIGSLTLDEGQHSGQITFKKSQ